MLIKGKDLTRRQSEQVLSAFHYRWTTGNCMRDEVYKNISKPTIPLQTDHDWINNHAFHFVKDGSRLMYNRHHCEPEFMAD